jgi:hypothetical protein
MSENFSEVAVYEAQGMYSVWRRDSIRYSNIDMHANVAQSIEHLSGAPH